MSKQDTYIAKMKLQLDELNLKMTTLEVKAKEAKDDAREAFDKEMAKLRADSKAAGAKLAEMKAAGEDAWDKMVGEMENLRTAFVKSFHYFKSQV